MLLDWDIVIREKNLVKCSDERPCGNIIAEHNDNIFVIKGETVITREYMIPKSKIHHYDGKELYLDMPYDKLTDFYYQLNSAFLFFDISKINKTAGDSTLPYYGCDFLVAVEPSCVDI